MHNLSTSLGKVRVHRVDLRSRSSHGKEDPCQQQLRIDIPSLDEEEERGSDDGVADYCHRPHAQAVRHKPPYRASYQGNDLIDEAESPDDVTNAFLHADQIRNDEGYAAVQEDEEGYGEQRDPQEVGGRLQGGGGRGEGEEAREGHGRCVLCLHGDQQNRVGDSEKLDCCHVVVYDLIGMVYT